MLNFFAVQADDGYGTLIWQLQPAGYVALGILLLLLLAAISMFHSKGAKKPFRTKQLVFSAAAIALAVISSMFTLFKLPMGGSITLFSMFFVTLIGYWYGLSVGLTAGVAYGILQLILGPYILSIPQLFLDYVFAFGALGLSGLFSNKKNGLILGYLLAVFGRFICSSISGVIFFGMNAPEAMNPVLYSVLYNGSYMGAEALMTVVLLAVPAVSKALKMIKKMAISL